MQGPSVCDVRYDVIQHLQHNCNGQIGTNKLFESLIAYQTSKQKTNQACDNLVHLLAYDF